MSTPNELTGTDGIDPQDLIVVWSRRNRDSRGVSFSELQEGVDATVQAAITAPVASAVAASALAQEAADDAQAAATAAADVVTGAVKKTDLAAGTGADVGVKLAGGVPRTLVDRASDLLSANDYASAQAAVTAAGSSGALLIPAAYQGNDKIANPNNIPIIDLRHQQLGFHSVLGTMYPVQDYPFGHDPVLRARASADLYLEHHHVEATTTQALVVGWNYNVLISAVTCGNRRMESVSGSGGAELFSTSAQITVGGETDNEEQVNQPNWQYVDATHIDILCTKTHTGTTDLVQGGSTLLASNDLYIVSSQVKPRQNTTWDAPLRVKDLGGRLICKIPSNIDNALPYGAWQWGSFQMGMFGANKHLYYQHALTTSKVIWRNAAGADIASLDNAGKMTLTSGVSTGVTPITPNGTAGEMQIGRMTVAVTSATDAYVAWMDGTNPLNATATAGSLLLAARNISGTSVNIVTQNTVRATYSVAGLKVLNGFGCNGKTPQAAVTVNAAATDAASTQALVNQLRALLIANGIAI